MRPRSCASFGAATFTSAYRAPPVAQPARSVKAQSAKIFRTRMSTPKQQLNDTTQQHSRMIGLGNQDELLASPAPREWRSIANVHADNDTARNRRSLALGTNGAEAHVSSGGDCHPHPQVVGGL